MWPRRMNDERTRRVMRWIMAAFYGAAGAVHLKAPDAFLPIVPTWVPAPRDAVLVTGVCEIAGAIALLVPRLRWIAGISGVLRTRSKRDSKQGIRLAWVESGNGQRR